MNRVPVDFVNFVSMGSSEKYVLSESERKRNCYYSCILGIALTLSFTAITFSVISGYYIWDLQHQMNNGTGWVRNDSSEISNNGNDALFSLIQDGGFDKCTCLNGLPGLPVSKKAQILMTTIDFNAVFCLREYAAHQERKGIPVLQ